jgi:tRNA-splicing ligase RtcB
MGDDAVIIEGVDSAVAREALYSTVHGAGRVMSRTAAKGKFQKIDGRRVRMEGLVRHDEMVKWLADKQVVLRGGDLDEAPQAYRRLPEVLAAHEGRSGFCTRCGRSALRWPAKISSILTRTSRGGSR